MKPWEWGEEGRFDHLLASQLRHLRTLIEDRIELDADDFDLTRTDGRWAGFLDDIDLPTVVYEPEQYFFATTHFEHTHDGLQRIPGGHAVHFHPGEQSVNQDYFQLDWKDVRHHFSDWLGYIARELDLDYESEEDEADNENESQPEPIVARSPEPDPPFPTGADEENESQPEPIVAQPPEPDPPVPTGAVVLPAPPESSPLQRIADWIKKEKDDRGAFWGVVAFVVIVGVAIFAAFL